MIPSMPYAAYAFVSSVPRLAPGFWEGPHNFLGFPTKCLIDFCDNSRPFSCTWKSVISERLLLCFFFWQRVGWSLAKLHHDEDPSRCYDHTHTLILLIVALSDEEWVLKTNHKVVASSHQSWSGGKSQRKKVRDLLGLWQSATLAQARMQWHSDWRFDGILMRNDISHSVCFVSGTLHLGGQNAPDDKPGALGWWHKLPGFVRWLRANSNSCFLDCIREGWIGRFRDPAYQELVEEPWQGPCLKKRLAVLTVLTLVVLLNLRDLYKSNSAELPQGRNHDWPAAQNQHAGDLSIQWDDLRS